MLSRYDSKGRQVVVPVTLDSRGRVSVSKRVRDDFDIEPGAELCLVVTSIREDSEVVYDADRDMLVDQSVPSTTDD